MLLTKLIFSKKVIVHSSLTTIFARYFLLHILEIYSLPHAPQYDSRFSQQVFPDNVGSSQTKKIAKW